MATIFPEPSRTFSEFLLVPISREEHVPENVCLETPSSASRTGEPVMKLTSRSLGYHAGRIEPRHGNRASPGAGDLVHLRVPVDRSSGGDGAQVKLFKRIRGKRLEPHPSTRSARCSELNKKTNTRPSRSRTTDVARKTARILTSRIQAQ